LHEPEFYRILLAGFMLLGFVFFIMLFRVPAPYGRHSRPGWGPTLNVRWGWLVMEAPAPLLFFYAYIAGQPRGTASLFFLLLWESHYLHRAFLYPFTLSGKKNMPLSVVGLGLGFNIINTYLQARWLFALAPPSAYGPEWLSDPRFLAGGLLFYAGFFLNKRADRILRQLRDGRTEDYAVPDKGLFRLVSCPNYLGEIVEWAGWALAVWSWAGLAFAAWTVFNLLPRALSHHRWYRETFPDYPAGRKALIPFLF